MSSEKRCPPHDWERKDGADVDTCTVCGVDYRTAHLGFGGNSTPQRHWKDGGRRRVTRPVT